MMTCASCSSVAGSAVKKQKLDSRRSTPQSVKRCSPSNMQLPPRPRSRRYRDLDTVVLPLLLLATLAYIPHANAESRLENDSFDCKRIQVGKKASYDLSKIEFPLVISHQESTPPSTFTSTLHLDLCEKLPYDQAAPARDQCPDNGSTRGCLVITNSKEGESDRIVEVVPLVSPAESSSTTVRWEAHALSKQKHDEEWRLKLSGAEYAGKQQTTIIDFKCDPKAEGDAAAPVWNHYDAREGELKLHWTTKHACSGDFDGGDWTGDDGRDSNGDGRGSPRSSGGWGFFSWFFFLLFVSFGVYFGLGIYRNYTQFGSFDIPHKEFWRESPYVAKDVASQLFRGIASVSSSGRASASRAGYEPL